MTAIERLAGAIGYPDAVPAGATEFVLKVDGAEMRAHEEGGRLILEQALEAADDQVVQLAEYAAGRILREEAVLAWDPTKGTPILWQGIAATATDDQLKRFFEVFAASCDWWRARTEAAPESVSIPTMMIRP